MNSQFDKDEWGIPEQASYQKKPSQISSPSFDPEWGIPEKVVSKEDDLKKFIMGSDPLQQIKSGLLGMVKGAENIVQTTTGGKPLIGAGTVPEFGKHIFDIKNVPGRTLAGYGEQELGDRSKPIYGQVEKMLGGSKAPLAEMMSQYAPLIAASPQSLLSQMLSGGAYQALQTPESPMRGGIEGALFPLPFKAAGAFKNVIGRAFKPTKPYEEALEEATRKSELATEEAISPKPGIYTHPKTELQSIENEIGKHINVEGEHGVRASNAINSRVNSIEDFWGNAYKNFLQKISDRQFVMPEQAMENLKYDIGEIQKRLQKGADPRKVVSQIEKEKNLSEKNPFYKNLISKAPTSKDISATDFLTKHKDFRDTLGGLKQDLRSERYGSIEKQQIKEAIDKGKEMESQIKSTLNEGLGEFKPEFDWINQGYSTQIYPLRSNPLVRAAKKGKMPDNMLKALRTDESGMDVLRDIVKQDPELLRNVIGQRYKSKPSSIYSPNELTREFLDEMPEFKKLLSHRENTLERLSKQKDISLKEYVKTQKELEEIKKAKSKGKKTLLIGAGLIGASPLVKSGIKLFEPAKQGEAP